MRDANEREVVALYERVGCTVYRHSKPGRESKYIKPGHPDLTVFHVGTAMMWYHEVKSSNGKLGPAQAHFIGIARACGVTVIVGGWAEAYAQLEAVGLIRQL